jgi:glycosyltransferase involved in cell wall biosynthesis
MGTLDQALASIAAQSRAPAEVVVGDDCSTDDTVAIAERWGTRLPVRVVRTPSNGGPAVARHHAISASSSPLLALLDADDVWFPDHLESLTSIWERVGGVAMGDALSWVPGEAVARLSWSELLPVPPPHEQLLALYLDNFAFVGSLFARTDYDATGGFRAQFHGTEDWDLWIRMARLGVPITAADHPTVLYRLTAGSLSSEDRLIDAKLAVLDHARREACSAAEVDAIRTGLRRLHAQRHLFTAYRLVGEGRSGAARLHGVAALRGTPRVARRGLAVAIAPVLTAARRGSARRLPTARLHG